jgi:hypothetical protein
MYCNSCNGNAMTCHCYGMHHHSIVRILVMLVVLGFVFIAGMKLGELKAEVALIYSQNDQSSMMHDRMMYQGGYGMNDRTTTIAIPAQPTTPTVAPAAAQ